MGISRTAYNRLRKRVAKATGRKLPACPKGPNGNELRFKRQILAGQGTYEPARIEITKSGSVYTPDFSYAEPSIRGATPRVVFIEVKGAYRSKKDEKLICERSRLAWEIAGDQHPEVDWMWAKYERGGYRCELRTGEKRLKAFLRTNAELENMLRGVI